MASTELRVKELLKERGWTTKVLSDKTGMSESYLTHIKNGTRRWNEDVLRKIADAFSLDPVLLFAGQCARRNVPALSTEQLLCEQAATGLNVHNIPVMGEIPSYPSPYNNEIMQATTGFKEVYVPVIEDFCEGMFCFAVENNSMSPRFVRGDFLIIAPAAEVESGQIVAIEYQTDRMYKTIAVVSFVDEFVLLESVNYKQTPIALVKGKDQFRIIGRVISRFQRLT